MMYVAVEVQVAGVVSMGGWVAKAYNTTTNDENVKRKEEKRNRNRNRNRKEEIFLGKDIFFEKKKTKKPKNPPPPKTQVNKLK